MADCIRRLRRGAAGITAFESERAWTAKAAWIGCDFRSPAVAGDVERWSKRREEESLC
jgi:hypothetical protein